MPFEELTIALRTGDPDVVISGLLQMLVEGETEWLKDSRDLMVALAPYHDCARRLGLDPSVVFDEAATAGPTSLSRIVRGFGHRRDVTPRSFGYALVDDEAGLRYEWNLTEELRLLAVRLAERADGADPGARPEAVGSDDDID